MNGGDVMYMINKKVCTHIISTPEEAQNKGIL